MRTKLKILISGGGTGGHIYPAVAIANELKSRNPSCEILFVGAEGKMEMEKVPKAGYNIKGLPIAGLNRSNLLSNFSFPFKLFRSLLQAYKIVREFQPQVAIGVGGYASGPTLIVANLLGVPTLIQEQNSYAGITNKWLSKRARKICVAYPNMHKFFPSDKVVFTGNPVRGDLKQKVDASEARAFFDLDESKKTVLVIGGSQGALSINKAIEKYIQQFESSDIQVLWQTGKSFYNRAITKTKELGSKTIFPKDFIYEMHMAYGAADVVVSRAGALSVSELCLAAKAAILVPFPKAAEDHQTHNAMSLVNNEAAVLLPDSKVDQIFDKVKELINNKTNIEKLETNIAKLAKPMATELIVNEIESIIGK